MCELMTILATAVFAVMALLRRRRGAPYRAFANTAFLFGGAALMWSVDCVHAAMEGEGLLDLSTDDAKLGLLVVAAGLIVHAVSWWREATNVRQAA